MVEFRVKALIDSADKAHTTWAAGLYIDAATTVSTYSPETICLIHYYYYWLEVRRLVSG